MKKTLKTLNQCAKDLRKRSTDTEKFLWKYLRSKRLENFRFRRQAPIGPYIVDFVCLEKRIVIECDGGQHAFQARKDKGRDDWLEKEGYKVLRFWDREVLQNTEGVLETILREISGSPAP
ncbi:MAG: endonuclease domain-containing protein [Deltaproteobacteria bacterium]|nr:endonuclease domain-containing protein [Deltaproteobacteria bacterium]